MALVKEYFELTEKYKADYGENTVVLMMVGSFFEVYGVLDKALNKISGSSIQDFSRVCELNVVEKNICVGANNDSVVMAGFKDIMIEKYVKKLQEAGFTSVVYTQKVQENNAITRECTAIFSPGTYFQTETPALNNNITCIWIQVVNPNFMVKSKTVVVGIANINIFTGDTSIFEYQEPFIMNPTTFDEMERFISIYNPSEVIVVANVAAEDLDTIIGYGNFNCKTIHKIDISQTIDTSASDFTKFAKRCQKQVYQTEILRKFFVQKWSTFDVFIQNFYHNEMATQAFCFLLDFVYRHNPNLVNKVKEPIFENCSDRLILANHTLKQLNIIDSTGYHDYTGKYSSVCKMLNECYTSMGKRLFNHQLLNPTTNASYLQKEYDIIEYLLQSVLVFQFEPFLKEIKDLSKWSRQIILSKIPVKSFCSIKHSLQLVMEILKICPDPTLQSYFQDKCSSSIPELSAVCASLIAYIEQHYMEEIAIEMDNNFDVNFFKSGVNAALDQKTAELKDAEDQLEAIRFHLNSLIPDKQSRSSSSDLIKIHETEKNVFNLLATSRRCKLLEDALPTEKRTVRIDYRSDKEPKSVNITLGKNVFEYVKQSASNSFIQNSVIGLLCRKINELKQEMKSLIAAAFNEFVSKFNSLALDQLGEFVSIVDVIFTKAMLARKYNYCKPDIASFSFTSPSSSSSFVRFTGIRHCLIEQLQQNEIYVTNDLTLGNSGVLLYGTNAVGKTSFIRSIGICIIMAQAGLYVPCSSFVYKPYKYIFSRIIGNDNLFKGLSTFAVEMSELRTILRLADENSMVLGDELCSGTENTSAISIFVAGIQHLSAKKCSFIFATHLHEIVTYDEILSLPAVQMKHMEVQYNKELDKLIYDRKLKDGPGNSLYGLEVCKSLSLPEEFLQTAYQIRLKYNPESQGSLEKKVSHYNAKKVMGMCEKCGLRMGSEVHHIVPQALANKDGVIRLEDGSVFHKNNAANLMTVCEKCHQDFHKK